MQALASEFALHAVMDVRNAFRGRLYKAITLVGYRYVTLVEVPANRDRLSVWLFPLWADA
jgi:hypothetical protein